MVKNWQHGVLKMIGVKDHVVTVTAVEDFTTWYRRVHFSAPSLAGQFAPFPTFWLRLWVPSLVPDKTVQRGYTFVDLNAETGEFALDFVLHQPLGAAAKWAQEVQVGDQTDISITPARPKIPAETSRYLLVGDTTALPAINSLIAQAAATDQIHTFVTLPQLDFNDLPLQQHPNNTVTWTQPGEDDRDMLARVATVAQSPGYDPGCTYFWCAGEKETVKRLRTLSSDPLGLVKSQTHSQFYWIQGRSSG